MLTLARGKLAYCISYHMTDVKCSLRCPDFAVSATTHRNLSYNYTCNLTLCLLFSAVLPSLCSIPRPPSPFHPTCPITLVVSVPLTPPFPVLKVDMDSCFQEVPPRNNPPHPHPIKFSVDPQVSFLPLLAPPPT